MKTSFRRIVGLAVSMVLILIALGFRWGTMTALWPMIRPILAVLLGFLLLAWACTDGLERFFRWLARRP